MRWVTWSARLVAVPAAVGTLILASCASGHGSVQGLETPAGGSALPATIGAPTGGPTAGAAAGPEVAATDPTHDPAATPAASVPATATRAARPPAKRPVAPRIRVAPPPARPAGATRRPAAAPTPAPAPRVSKTAPAKGAPKAPTGMTAAEAEVLRLVNGQRASNGCGPLASKPVLLKVARAHSIDMAVHGYFDHTSPDGRSPFDRMRDAGYAGGAMAENIAAGQRTPAAVMDAWMHSAGHRANILNCTYRVIGIGVSSKAGSPLGIYWTQDFGDR